jgi:arsenite methyltransferase
VDRDEVHARVRTAYAQAAEAEWSAQRAARAHRNARLLGYSDEQIAAVPDGTLLGIGSGNPIDVARLRSGEFVVDLGCGSGADAILAARAVAPGGRVIGVDMTDAMLVRAGANAASVGAENAEFVQGTIESVPLPDGSVDVVISNGVINLSPERERVLGEAHRVLRPRGRLAFTDLAIERPLPPETVSLVRGWLGFLISPDAYTRAVAAAGFSAVEIVSRMDWGTRVFADDPGLLDAAKAREIPQAALEEFFRATISLHIRARKE